MFEKLIAKFGVDKLLHFFAGAVVTFVISNVLILQEGTAGVDNLWFPIAGIIATMVLETMKEFIIDTTPDKKDMLATFLGSLVPFVVNAIGILFYVLSN